MIQITTPVTSKQLVEIPDAEWPVVGGRAWLPKIFVCMCDWWAMEERERVAITQWFDNHGREIRETTCFGRKVLMHYPAADPAGLYPIRMTQFELSVSSEWVRHADEVRIVVENINDPARAEAVVREWLADLAEVGLDPAPQLTE